jgi:hypothetical protein
MNDWTVAARIAAATGEAAAAEGLARNPMSRNDLHRIALDTIGRSRACVERLVEAGLIHRAVNGSIGQQARRTNFTLT